MTEYQSTCKIRGDGGRAIRTVLDRIGDKWTLLVVGTLEPGPARFTELLRRVPGISQRMLTRTLKGLARDGLVVRTAFAEVPPRVEYELTPLGASLIEPALALASWAIEHNPAIEQHQVEHDAAGPASAARPGGLARAGALAASVDPSFDGGDEGAPR